MVALNISESHKTAENIKLRNSFTVSIEDVSYIKETDYLGTVSGNDVPDKFSQTGLYTVKINRVDAPIIEDFPPGDCFLRQSVWQVLLLERYYGKRQLLRHCISKSIQHSTADQKRKLYIRGA